MNTKDIGDVGCNCVIGELAKYGIGIAFPLSDNYPFDLIAIAGKKLFKIQIKSSSTIFQGAVSFKATTNNFRTKETYKYSTEDIDAFAFYDLINHKLYLVSPKDMKGKSTFRIRITQPKRNGGRYNMAENYIISKERVKELFEFDTPNYLYNLSNKQHKRHKRKIHNHFCKNCNKEFTSEEYHSKYCSRECMAIYQQKVQRPTKEQLLKDLLELPITRIGEKYGVSDNAIRKWAAKYKLECIKENDKWIWIDSSVQIINGISQGREPEKN